MEPVRSDVDCVARSLSEPSAFEFIGLIFRPRRLVGPLGLDSAVVVAFYAIGIIGLVFVNR